MDIACKKQQIKVRFFLNLLGFLVGVDYSNLLGLEFGLKFTFTISVSGMVDSVNVGYACITMGINVDQIVCLKMGVHWLITSNTTVHIYTDDLKESWLLVSYHFMSDCSGSVILVWLSYCLQYNWVV